VTKEKLTPGLSLMHLVTNQPSLKAASTRA